MNEHCPRCEKELGLILDMYDCYCPSPLDTSEDAYRQEGERHSE